jgi:hypothetical protein
MISSLVIAQHTEIELNSSITNPHVQILETGPGLTAFGRLFFRNSNDINNRWSLAALPQTGSLFSTLDSPIGFFFNGNDRFLVSRDGRVRFNNSFTFPNADGAAGQVLTTDGSGNVSWAAAGGISTLLQDTDGDTKIELLEGSGTIDEIVFETNGVEAFNMNTGTTGNNTRLVIENDVTKAGFQSARIDFINTTETSDVGSIGYTEAGGTKVLDIFGDDRTVIRGGFNDSGMEARMAIGKFQDNSSGTVFVNNGSSTPISTDATVDVRGDLLAEEVRVETTGFGGITVTGDDTGDARMRIVNGTGNHFLFDDDSNLHALKLQSSGDFAINTGGTVEKMRIEADGDMELGIDAVFIDERGIVDRLGVNTLPATALHINHFNNSVSGGFRLQNNVGGNWWKFYVSSSANTLQLRNNTSGSVVGTFATGGMYTASDKRLKKNIESMPYGLKDIMKLNALRYDYISDDSNSNKSIGFIAQDLNNVIPELVLYQEDADQYSVNYAGMSVIAIKAIQDQQIIIDEVKAENAELKKQIETILARLDAAGK